MSVQRLSSHNLARARLCQQHAHDGHAAVAWQRSRPAVVAEATPSRRAADSPQGQPRHDHGQERARTAVRMVTVDTGYATTSGDVHGF
jgi:hypothetical protein